MIPRPRRRGVIILVLALAIAACSSEDRPDTASWLARWDAIVAVVPPQVQLGDPPNATTCQDTLVAIRTENEGLLPSPSVTVDDLVAEWVGVAEAAFFECPPEGDDIGSFADAYEEMQRIEESVKTALSDQG